MPSGGVEQRVSVCYPGRPMQRDVYAAGPSRDLLYAGLNGPGAAAWAGVCPGVCYAGRATEDRGGGRRWQPAHAVRLSGHFCPGASHLTLVVIDNGSYGTTGDQPTLTRTHVSLEGVARAFGLTNTATVGTPRELEHRLYTVLLSPGPSLTVVLVQPGAPTTSLVPLSPAAIAERFQDACRSAAYAPHTGSSTVTVQAHEVFFRSRKHLSDRNKKQWHTR